MTKVFICAFNYDKTKHELPAIALDAWRFYQVIGKYAPGAQIYFITDIDGKEITQNISSSVEERNKVLRFISDSPVGKVPNLTYVNGRSLNDISKFLTHDVTEKYIFYYTGHGDENGLIFPDDLVTPRELLSIFEGKNVLIILDCCAIHDIGLPYVFEKEEIVKKSKFKGGMAICMTASTSWNDAFSSNKGSLFTEGLYRTLKSSDVGVKDLKTNIEDHIRKRYNIDQPVVVSYNHRLIKNLKLSEYLN
jgi:hypothetical protein